ncbi:MAG TPA: nucleoside recognition domain-containing protein [Bacteroidales bacterium]|nr:nucleoside recognition domain-containing protein [Bacteroidales bacterium]
MLRSSFGLWVFYPREAKFSQDYNSKIEQLEKQKIAVATPSTKKTNDELDKQIESLTLAREGERQEQSYAGKIGRFIEPVLAPLGFDWKMAISLVSGLAAKEVVVSTMGVLYQVGSDNEDNQGLIHKLQGTPQTLNQAGIYSKSSALSFMIFILIYSPCIAVIAAIGKESGNWKWAAFTVAYTTGLAWIVSFITFQISTWVF